MPYLRNALLLSLTVLVIACSNNGPEHEIDIQSAEEQSSSGLKTKTGPLTRIIRGDGHVSSFYSFEGDLPSKPGVLLRNEALSEKQSVPGADKNIRLLYTSTDGIDGQTIIPVSGTLLMPAGTPPEGGWPLVLWSHGTVGIADRCAPSWNGYREFHQDYIRNWLDQGYAVVTSDYQGLGTPGTHPYLATRTSSYSNLDVIRAVQNANFPVAKKIVLIGQSQGAAAAFATGGYLQDYAPELDIRGIVATGIPFFSAEGLAAVNAARPRDKVDRMLGYNFLALTLIEQMDPDFKVSDYVTDEAMDIVQSLDTQCHQDVTPMIVERGLTYNKSFKQSPNDALQIAFAQMGYPNFKLSMPVYVGSGMQDRDTPLRMQAALVKKTCEAGAVVESHVYDGYDHLTVLNHSTRDSTPFVKAAFAGESITGNCASLPF